jgi:hypothetical protein
MFLVSLFWRWDVVSLTLLHIRSFIIGNLLIYRMNLRAMILQGSAGRICHLENVKSYFSYLQQCTKIIKMFTIHMRAMKYTNKKKFIRNFESLYNKQYN